MPGQQFPELGNLFSFDNWLIPGFSLFLVLLMIIGFTKQQKFSKLREKPIKYSLLISLFYASILELSQSLIPDRYANFYDMAFHILGVLVGYIFFLLIYKLSFD
jgi:VanZ family protein